MRIEAASKEPNERVQHGDVADVSPETVIMKGLDHKDLSKKEWLLLAGGAVVAIVTWYIVDLIRMTGKP